MAVQGTSRAFKDISFSFSPHPVTKDLPVLINERAVTRLSLIHISEPTRLQSITKARICFKKKKWWW